MPNYASDYTTGRVYDFLLSLSDGFGWAGDATDIARAMPGVPVGRDTVKGALHRIRRNSMLPGDLPYLPGRGYRLFGDISDANDHHARNADHKDARTITQNAQAQKIASRLGYQLPAATGMVGPDPRKAILSAVALDFLGTSPAMRGAFSVSVNVYRLSMMDYDNFSREYFRKYVQRTVEALTAHADAFDSIVVRGNSGLALGAPVAFLVDKPVVIVRKDNESAHTSKLISNFEEIGNRYVVVDDFVSTGATLEAIRDAVGEVSTASNYWRDWREDHEFPVPEYVSCYQYHYDKWHKGFPDARPELAAEVSNVRVLDRYTIRPEYR